PSVGVASIVRLRRAAVADEADTRSATAKTTLRRTCESLVVRYRDRERYGVEKSVEDHPRDHALDARSEVRQPCAERREKGKRLDETVRDAERDAHDHDRRPGSERFQQREADTTKGQLLDDRRNDGDHQSV